MSSLIDIPVEVIFLVFEQAVLWYPRSVYPLVVSVPYISRELRRRGKTVANFLDDGVRTRITRCRYGVTVSSVLGNHTHGVQRHMIPELSREVTHISNHVYSRVHGYGLTHVRTQYCDRGVVQRYNKGTPSKYTVRVKAASGLVRFTLCVRDKPCMQPVEIVGVVDPGFLLREYAVYYEYMRALYCGQQRLRENTAGDLARLAVI